MKNTIDRELEAKFARLGIAELEERLEISPLLASDPEGGSGCCSHFCDCRVDPYPQIMDPYYP